MCSSLVLENIQSLLMIQRNGADYAVYINTGQEVSSHISNVEGRELMDSTTGLILAHVLMKLYHGVKSEWVLKASR